MMTLQAPLGPDGRWEVWFPLDSPERIERAERLVAKYPGRWRIVAA